MVVYCGGINIMFTFMFASKITVSFGYMNRQHESYEVGWDI